MKWKALQEKKATKLSFSGIQSQAGLFLGSDLSVRRRVPNLLLSLKREKLKSSFVWISFLEKHNLYSSQMKWWDCKKHFVRSAGLDSDNRASELITLWFLFNNSFAESV